MSIRPTPTSALLWASVLFGFFLAAYGYPLRLPDEPRVAHTAYEMGRTSDWYLPEVNGEPFLQTPPLHYDLLSVWFRCVGTRPDGNARIPSILFTLGTIALVARRARRARDSSEAAVFATAILASTAQFFEMGHTVVVEPGLTFFCTLALLELETLLASRTVPALSSVLLGVAAGGAFLAKGLPGPLLIAVVGTSTAVIVRRSVSLRGLVPGLLIAGVVAALTVAPWLIGFTLSHPDRLQTLLVDHVVGRVLEGTGGKDASKFEFMHRALGNLLPWALLLPFAIRGHVLAVFPSLARGGAAPLPAEKRLHSALLLSWALVPVVLLLFSVSKRNLYLAPLLPAFALLTSEWLTAHLARHERPRWTRAVFLVAAIAAVSGLLAVPIAQWLGVGRPTWQCMIAASPLLVAAAATFVSWRREARVERRCALCFIVIAVASWGTSRHLYRESERSVARFGDALARREREGHPVIGYRLSEREVAAVAWALRHPFAACDDAASLARLIEQCAAPLVVGEERDLSEESLPEVAEAPVVLEKGLRRRRLQVRSLADSP